MHAPSSAVWGGRRLALHGPGDLSNGTSEASGGNVNGIICGRCADEKHKMITADPGRFF